MIAIYGNYLIPNSLTNLVTNNATAILLLNNEFIADTTLLGFELYAAKSGILSIQVKFEILICLNYKKTIIK